MRRVKAIAICTALEAFRRRTIYVVLFFALALILFLGNASFFGLGVQEKFLKDFGLSLLSLFGLLLALYLSPGSIQTDIERKTIYNVLSKPVRKEDLIFGKFIGISIVILASFAIMLSILVSFILIRGGSVGLGFLTASALIYLEILILVSISIFLSSSIPTVIGASIVLAIYVLGHMKGGYMKELKGDVASNLARIALSFIPSLYGFDMKSIAVHGGVIPTLYLLQILGYWIIWVVIPLWLGSILLGRKDL
jgi:ABC-type transport system involved in multi-copper enzyme maturation permease subunit